MDFEIRFEKEKGYFIIETSGETSPHDIEASLKQVFGGQDWKTGTNILYNNQHEIADNLSVGDVRKMAPRFFVWVSRGCSSPLSRLQ